MNGVVADTSIGAGLSDSAGELLGRLREQFGDVFVCPKCRGAVGASADDRFVECVKGCGKVAAAREGVLDFVAIERDDRGQQAGFGYQWEQVMRGRLDEQIVYNNTPEDLWNGINGWLKLGGSLEGKTLLDVGCGHGQYCRVAAAHGGKAMGCDLSEVVYRSTSEDARSSDPKRKNAAFVRTDILNFPVADSSFDYVLSIGMAHHTPDTKAAVMAATRCVKPGGKMLLYIYELGKGGVGYITLRHTFTLPAKLPRPLMLLTCKVMSWPLAFYLAGRRGKLPTGRTFQAAFLGLFDAYCPTYSFRHAPQECMGWLREAGFVDVERVMACFFVGKRPG